MQKINVGLAIFVFLMIIGCKNVHQKENTNSTDQDNATHLLESGKEIASSTFLALSSALQTAMTSGGVENAIAYCNLNAIAITDSLASLHQADIKRTSLKFRNPKNKPNPLEEIILREFEEQQKGGQSILPKLVQQENSTVFYAPIITQDMCLKCHGPKENIDKYNVISQLYPEDLAFGYKQGDLRGMWSIRFRNDQKIH